MGLDFAVISKLFWSWSGFGAVVHFSANPYYPSIVELCGVKISSVCVSAADSMYVGHDLGDYCYFGANLFSDGAGIFSGSSGDIFAVSVVDDADWQ